MQVREYTFQSPYPSPVQVGRLDSNSVKEDGTKSSGETFKPLNETQQKAELVKNEMSGDVTPTVSQTSGLDVYA